MAEQSRLQLVGEIPDTPQAPPAPKSDPIVKVSADALLLALRALSQRFVVALANLFTLLTVGSAFWLWWSIPDPSNTQLASLGMYALFVVAINVIVRKLK